MQQPLGPAAGELLAQDVPAEQVAQCPHHHALVEGEVPLRHSTAAHRNGIVESAGAIDVELGAQAAQLGLDEAGYGYWGFSPSSNPAGGYREYGVDVLGMDTIGYTSDVERLTSIESGWDDPACFRAAQTIDDYGEGVVTPHAAFLALDFDREAALENLANLAADFDGMYGRGGFKDAVNVATGQVADRYLALDQGMVIAAIANELTGDELQGYLATTLEASMHPLMEIERFGAGHVAP